MAGKLYTELSAATSYNTVNDRLLIGQGGALKQAPLSVLPFVLLAAHRYAPPLASVFPTILGTNSVNPTLTDTSDRGLVMNFKASPAAGDNNRLCLKTKPNLANFSVIARLRFSSLGFDYQSHGLVMRNSSTGKLVTFGFVPGSTYRIRIMRWDAQNTFNGERLFAYAPNAMEWLRWDIASGDPRYFYCSVNGQDWLQILDESQSAFLGTFDQIGLCMSIIETGGPRPVAGTDRAFMNVLYWDDGETVPSIVKYG